MIATTLRLASKRHQHFVDEIKPTINIATTNDNNATTNHNNAKDLYVYARVHQPRYGINAERMTSKYINQHQEIFYTGASASRI